MLKINVLSATAAFVFFMGSSAMGAQNNLMSGQVSLTNLRYSLLDLDPIDEVSPSVKFLEPSASYQGDALVSNDKVELKGSSPFNVFDKGFSLSTPNGDARVAATSQGPTASTHVLFGNTDFQNQKDVLASTSNWVETGLGIAPDFESFGNFVLSPHTRFVLEGTVNFDLSINQPLMASLRAKDGKVWALADGDAYMYLTMEAGDTDWVDVSNWKNLRIDSEGAASENNNITGPTIFKLTIDNEKDEAKNGIFRYSLYSHSQMNINNPTVPEPSTLALMALGLGWMGWRTRPARRV